MPSKKNIPNVNDEISIDIVQLLKKWWYFRKFIVFGTLIVLLSSLFILILASKTLKGNKYTSTVLRDDLGDNDILIVDTLNSIDIIDKTIKVLSLEVSANELLDHLIITKGTTPNTVKLKSRINSFVDSDLKKLALSNDDLKLMVEDLDEASSDKITIEFYHSPLNLNDKQAINFIKKLVNSANNNIQKYTTSSDNKLNKIDTKIFDLKGDNSELIIIFTNILRSIEKNIAELKDYKNILVNIDLEKMSTFATISKKILMETSTLVGSTYALEVLNLEIITIERNIKDLKNSLLVIDRVTASSEDNYDITEKKSSINIALDGDTFKSILSIGSALQLNEFRVETLKKIQNLQLEQTKLLNEKELLKLPFEYTYEDLSLENISARVLGLTKEINIAIAQVYKFTQPKRAIQFISNPEVIKTNEELIHTSLKNSLILSLLGFFCLSFMAFLMPRKN